MANNEDLGSHGRGLHCAEDLQQVIRALESFGGGEGRRHLDAELDLES